MSKVKKRNVAGFVILIIITAVLAAGCGGSGSSNPPDNAGAGYRDITADQLKSMMENEKNLLVVDVREQEEFAGGHINGAVLLPTSEFASRFTELATDKKIVLVCATGSRSSQAAAYLVQQGYKEVYNLNGGMAAWPYDVVK